MSEIETVEMKQCFKIEASGDDIESLLFHFLDELLFLFSAEPFLICPKLEISKFDLADFEIECLCYGEPFQLGKHPQGSEVKAITYSAMQIIQKSNQNDVYVIIDIWARSTIDKNPNNDYPINVFRCTNSWIEMNKYEHTQHII